MAGPSDQPSDHQPADEAVAAAEEEVLLVPFCRSMGLRFLEAGRNRAVVVLPERQELGTRIGTVHPLALASPAEAATGFLARLAFGDLIDEGASLQLKALAMRLRRQARGALTAVATVAPDDVDVWVRQFRADGRLDAVLDVETFDQHDQVVALVSATWALRA